MSRPISRFAAAALAASLVIAACGEDTPDDSAPDSDATTVTSQVAPTEPPVSEPGTIVEVAVNSGAFPTLVAAVQAAGLVDTLNSEGPFTVFAPTEEAFATALDQLGITADDLLADTELLTAVLTYHVLPIEAPAALVATLDGQTVTTVNGAQIAISINGTVQVNNATVLTTDPAWSVDRGVTWRPSDVAMSVTLTYP